MAVVQQLVSGDTMRSKRAVMMDGAHAYTALTDRSID